MSQTAAHEEGQSSALCYLLENIRGIKILTPHSHKISPSKHGKLLTKQPECYLC